jgi:hypothetical protein
LPGAAGNPQEPQAPEDAIAGRAGPQDAEASEAVRKSDSKSVDFRSAAEDGHSLARLERINRVGAEVSRSDGLVTDTALKYASGASL